MSRPQKIAVQAETPAPIEDVWKLLADATTWSDWAGFSVAEYATPGDLEPHGVGAIRRFEIGPLRSHEKVLEFDPPRRLAYDYAGTLPVRNYRAEVTLTPAWYRAGAGTHISWRTTYEGKFPAAGRLLRPSLWFVLKRIADRLAEAATAQHAAARTVHDAAAGGR